jgi:hypothetical protein
VDELRLGARVDRVRTVRGVESLERADAIEGGSRDQQIRVRALR